MRKFFILTMLFFVCACQSESRKKIISLQQIELLTPSGKSIKTYLAKSPSEQEQGLSGVKDSEFDNDEGMLFYYEEDSEKYFWMPDTYFDLDLFYLNKSLKIIDIVRKLPHHKGRINPNLIPRARAVWSRHVLEMKSSSEIAAALKVGDQLKRKGESGQ